MIFAKKDSVNDASGFSNIGYSMSRHRRRNRFGLWVRNWRAVYAAKSASISLVRLVLLICLLYVGIFLVRTGLMFCSSALARHSGQVGVSSRATENAVETPFLVKNNGEKGDIRQK